MTDDELTAFQGEQRFRCDILRKYRIEHGQPVIKLRYPLLLVCKADLKHLGIMKNDEDIFLKNWNRHISECELCSRFLDLDTSVVLLTAEDMVNWKEGYLSEDEKRDFDYVAESYRQDLMKNSPLYNLFFVLNRLGKLPFAFADIPYVCLRRLFEEVSESVIAELFDVPKSAVTRRRNLFNVIQGRAVNHVYELLKEAAITMLAQGESVDDVHERTGIDLRSLRNLKSYVYRGSYG